MKHIITYCIFLFCCGFTGFICSKSKIKLKDWRFWALIGCVIGAYWCGSY